MSVNAGTWRKGHGTGMRTAEHSDSALRRTPLPPLLQPDSTANGCMSLLHGNASVAFSARAARLAVQLSFCTSNNASAPVVVPAPIIPSSSSAVTKSHLYCSR